MIPISKPYIGEEEINAVAEVLRSGIIAQGPKVKQLEEEFARFCGIKYAVAVNNGTAALHTALHSAGIKEGDEVITTPFTFISTASSIRMAGATPVFADIDEETFNINPNEVENKITEKTRAIIAVDLFGHPCDYDKIASITKRNNLVVVEDASQSVDAEFNKKKSGSFGDAAIFSFYATKNITCGEGGIIATGNKETANKSILFRQHGRPDMGGYGYTALGYNYRMADINAAMLIEQLKKISFITKRRIENAEYLARHLSKIKGIKVPIAKSGNKHVFHQFTIKVEDFFRLTRDQLAGYLEEKGIGSGIYYPKPLHLLKQFEKFGYTEGDFPVAEGASKKVISLPVHPHVTKEQLEYIISIFNGI